jgi:hypothetical protein
VVWGAVPVALAATFWFWPKREMTSRRVDSELLP